MRLSLFLLALAILAACRGGGGGGGEEGAVDTTVRRGAGEGGEGSGGGESAAADTTGLTIPGADSLPPKTAAADSLLALTAAAPSRGPEDAMIVIIEFSDFECPFCARARDTLQRFMEERPHVRLIYMQYPILSLHPRAMLPAEASLEAHRQGKFWQYHDALFAHGTPLDREAVLQVAREQGLDVDAVKEALELGTHRAQVEREMQIGEKLAIGGTPTFFINGYRVVGAQPYEAFVAAYNILLRASRRAGLAEARTAP